MEKSPEIVITGLGVVTSIGSGIETFWNSLMSGACGITLYEGWDTDELLDSGLNNPFVGAIKELDKKRIRPRKSIKVMARDIQVGVAAADYAWEDAQLNEKPVDPERQGIVYGAMMPLADLWEIVPLYKGAMDEEQNFVESRFGSNMDTMYPLWMLKYLPNMTACHIGVANDLRGPSNTLVVGDMGGVSAVIEAIRAIERGAADLMYTGGCNSSTIPHNQSHFQMFPETRERSDVSKGYRPFDVNRDGMVVGECGGSAIIETRESAEKRDVPIYCKILGYGETAEAVWNSGTDFAPQQEEVKINVEMFTGKCISNAIKLAMERSGLKPEDLAFVMAHGIGSQFHDRKEAEAIAANVGSDVPVTCVNSATGYAFCGSSAVSVAAAVEALKQNTIPAIVNCAEPDPTLPVNLVTGSPKPIEAGKKAALIVAYNYYGQAAALVVSK